LSGGMIDLNILVPILVGLVIIGGAIITFFQMQTRQNMKIDTLEKEVMELERKQAEQSHYQIQTEKDIVRINEKLDTILEAICELKDRRRAART
jgi:septal ring factor EnvC (AmiA/AmiB activator)